MDHGIVLDTSLREAAIWGRQGEMRSWRGKCESNRYCQAV